MTNKEKAQNFILAIESVANVSFTEKYAKVFTERIEKFLDKINDPMVKYLVFDDFNFTGHPEDLDYTLHTPESSQEEMYRSWMDDSYDPNIEFESASVLGLIDLETAEYFKLYVDGSIIKYSDYLKPENYSGFSINLKLFNEFNKN